MDARVPRPRPHPPTAGSSRSGAAGRAIPVWAIRPSLRKVARRAARKREVPTISVWPGRLGSCASAVVPSASAVGRVAAPGAPCRLPCRHPFEARSRRVLRRDGVAERRQHHVVRLAATSAGVFLAVIGLGISVAAGTSDARSTPLSGASVSSGSALPPSVARRLEALARGLVDSLGDARVHTADVILTTREHAAGGDIVDSNQPVYELVMRGKFVCVSCSRPSGAHAPRGTVAVLTVDRRTFHVTDFGISDRAPRRPVGAQQYQIRF